MTPLPLLVGVALWCMAAIASLLLAVLVHRVVRTDETGLNLATFAAVWVGVTTALALVAGLLGVLTATGLAGLSAALVGVTALFPHGRQALRQIPADARGTLGEGRSWWTSLPRPLRVAAVALVGVLTVRFVVLIWTLPPFIWDALTYHLTNVATWTQSGKLIMIDSPVTRTYLPANFEVFSTWFTVFLHHDILVEAAGIPGYLIACIAVYALARRLACAAPAALVASLAYATTPALVLAATGTKNDPLMTGIILLMAALVVDLVVRPAASPQRNRSGQLALLLALGLYGLGTKAYLLHVSVGILVIAWMLPREAGNPRAWRRVLGEARAELQAGSARRKAALACLLGVSLFLGLYWYGRNFALTGNPFYPMGVELGAATVIAGAHNNFPLSLARLAENLASFWTKFGDRNGPIVPDLPNTTGWGWIAYGIGLPTTVWALIRLRLVRVVVLGFIVSLAVLFLSARASPWNMRYATWFPAVLCLTAAGFLQALPSEWRGERRALGALLVVGIVMNVLPMLNYGRIPLEEFKRMLAKPALERSAASLYMTIGDSYEFAVATVPDDEVLGYHVSSNGFIYPLFGAGFSQPIAFVRFDRTTPCPQIVEALHAAGTRWLFMGYTGYREVDRVRSCVKAGFFMDRGESLYELNNPSG